MVSVTQLVSTVERNEHISCCSTMLDNIGGDNIAAQYICDMFDNLKVVTKVGDRDLMDRAWN